MQRLANLMLIAAAITFFFNPISLVLCQETQEELSDMELIERVAFLQRELEAPELSRRDAAEKELLQHGVRVLDYLEPTTPKTPTDAVERTNRVRQALEKIAVASVTKASLVTLKGSMSVRKALEKIRQQTKNDIAMPDTTPDVFRDREIELDLENSTFWEAVAIVMEKGDLVVDPYAGLPGQLRVTPTNAARIAAANPGAVDPTQKPEQANAESPEPPRSVSGIFDTLVTQVTSSRNLTNPALNYCNIRVTVRWEPRVTPISIDLPFSSLKAVDEFDNPIKIANQDGVLSGMVLPEVPELEFSIPIALVDRQIENIQSLDAIIDAVLPGRVETFRFKNIGNVAAGTSQTKAGAIVTFGGISKNEDLYGVTVGLKFDEGHNALESYQNWVRNNRLYLEDPQGEKFEWLADDLVSQSNNEVVIRYYFEQDPKKTTLVYKTPAAIVKIPVKITLKNIPLP
jgi:hypothetical protein